MPPRTFKLGSPHMTGEDVRGLQQDLNFRYDAWDIGKRIAEDGDYGVRTRDAAKEVCIGLGVDAAEMAGGVTPELRTKLRHPERRTPEELARAGAPPAKQLRAKLRKQFDTSGQVTIAPGANLPGRGIAPMTLDYISRMAARINRPITITTGTNHSQFTTSGNVSDHFTGHAVDLGMIANHGTDDGPVGDRIMAAGLMLAGFPSRDAKAKARAGGLFTIPNHDGMRIQCIWKTDMGGNHHNHVHIGVRPA
jgi:hypothetical protein